MCVAYFLILLDVTVVNVALPQIGSGLRSSVSGLQWVVDGYGLALAALLLAGGTIGDLRGHKPVVLTGLCCFGAASLAAGLAPSTATLIAARMAQGVGGALMLPGTLAIISQAFPDAGEQARAIGMWAGIGSVGLPAGPLLGGLLVQALGWRSVFFLNVPVVAGAAVVVARVVPAAATDQSDAQWDRAGTALGAAGLAATTFAVIRAGHAGPDSAMIAAAVVAAVSLTGFLWVEQRATQPILPLALFRRPAFAAANAVAAVMNLGTLGLIFLLTLFLQDLQQRSALTAGLMVLPLFLPLSLLAPLTGRVTARLGPARPMQLGLLLAATGVGLLATWSPATTYVALLPAMLGWGIGLGLLTPAVVAAAVAAAPADRAGLASGVNNTARQTGGAIGIAVYGAIAGQPSSSRHFLTGLHVTGLITTGLFVAAAVCTTAFIPGRRDHDRPQ